MSIHWTDPGGFHCPQCAHCEHLRPYQKCAAFPDGIPQAILDNEHDHRKPYPSDNGVLFASKRGEPVQEDWFEPLRKPVKT